MHIHLKYILKLSYPIYDFKCIYINIKLFRQNIRQKNNTFVKKNNDFLNKKNEYEKKQLFLQFTIYICIYHVNVLKYMKITNSVKKIWQQKKNRR